MCYPDYSQEGGSNTFLFSFLVMGDYVGCMCMALVFSDDQFSAGFHAEVDLRTFQQFQYFR